MIDECHSICRLLMILCAAVLGGCASHEAESVGSVAAAWGSTRGTAPSGQQESQPRSVEGASDVSGASTEREPPIATVDGRAISRSRFMDLLVRSHGAGVLEQLIGLEATVTAATDKGLTVSQVDVDQEYARALRRVSDPLSSATEDEYDRTSAERVLETVLAQRNISREEFDIIMRRNAYLRKIVESQQSFSDEQLRREYERAYGPRVRVRHIQLATLREVETVKSQLASGEDFGELAARYSANTVSAKAKGLLRPFSAQDEEIPAVFRQVAFTLSVGQVSDAVRVGEWYHLIRLEELLPPEDRDFGQVRDELTRRLRERVTEPAMFDLFEELFKQAKIRIYDPGLRERFEAGHSDRVRRQGG